MKALFADTDFAREIGLTAVNSINFARIAAQCVYYFTATAALGKPATFVVPTGNFGDIFAGEAAQRMGLAVERLVIATNANDIMARALNDGVYAVGRGAPHPQPLDGHPGGVAISSAPCSKPPAATPTGPRAAMSDFRARPADWCCRQPVLGAPARPLQRLRQRRRRHAAPPSPRVASRLGPHHRSAHRRGGRRRAQDAACRDAPVVILSTAHPAKFPDAVTQRHRRAAAHARRACSGLLDLPERLEILPNDLALIRQFISSRLAA